mmetsp:Transcript_13882/g.23688  ORF Transcript_13882/g.23688 Transcript_13882/m.23688 type:complete len:319 (+) Transcript_13882:215-1171(+)
MLVPAEDVRLLGLDRLFASFVGGGCSTLSPGVPRCTDTVFTGAVAGCSAIPFPGRDPDVNLALALLFFDFLFEPLEISVKGLLSLLALFLVPVGADSGAELVAPATSLISTGVCADAPFAFNADSADLFSVSSSSPSLSPSPSASPSPSPFLPFFLSFCLCFLSFFFSLAFRSRSSSWSNSIMYASTPASLISDRYLNTCSLRKSRARNTGVSPFQFFSQIKCLPPYFSTINLAASRFPKTAAKCRGVFPNPTSELHRSSISTSSTSTLPIIAKQTISKSETGGPISSSSSTLYDAESGSMPSSSSVSISSSKYASSE